MLTVSTVMTGPPDFSTTRSPDLITVIGKTHGQSDEIGLRLHRNNNHLLQLPHPRGTKGDEFVSRAPVAQSGTTQEGNIKGTAAAS